MSTPTLEMAVEQAIIGGSTLIQLREKKVSSFDFYKTACQVKKITDHYAVPLIINDRVDLALAVGAAGVHVGQSDLPAQVVRYIMGKDKILGVSVSSLKEAVKAQEDGADYLGVGAMFATGTKADAALVTKDELKQIRATVSLPLVVIGGINKSTIPQFMDIDIDGIAVISAIISEKDIPLAARQLKELLTATRRRERI